MVASSPAARPVQWGNSRRLSGGAPLVDDLHILDLMSLLISLILGLWGGLMCHFFPLKAYGSIDHVVLCSRIGGSQWQPRTFGR